MNLSLYEISAQYRQAFLKLADSELDDQTIDDTLEGLDGELEAKATNVAAFIRNLEASTDAIKQAEKQMAERRKAIEAKAERLKTYLKTNMEACGMTEISCPLFTLKIKRNPPSVVIDDAGQIGTDYYVYPEAPPPYPDKKLIAQAIKDGFEVAGAHLESGTRLEIK